MEKVKSTHETGDCQTGSAQDPAAAPIKSFGHRHVYASCLHLTHAQQGFLFSMMKNVHFTCAS
jgi:hypothetical protein